VNRAIRNRNPLSPLPQSAAARMLLSPEPAWRTRSP
jgi:hypothetical protein